MQYSFSRAMGRTFLRAVGQPHFAGVSNLPSSGAAILASNHLSMLDPAYVYFFADRLVTYAVNADCFNTRKPIGRLWAAYLRWTCQLSLDRADTRSAQGTLDAALGVLRKGELFGIYPEGTRSPDGRLYRGRSGLGYLALRSGAPVVPVGVIGTRKMLPPGTWIPRPHHIEVRFGTPLTFTDVLGLPQAKARNVIADRVMEAIAELSGQEYVHMYASDRKAQLAV
jgi:1-acyl-sn-glycerol-3-phosphate acyltransferase